MAIQQGQQYIPGSVGKKLPGMQVRVGEDGELFFKGNSLFKGYYKNEEATREVVNDRWLSTGDIGKIDENGNIAIIDRKKDILITSGGKNVSPSEIEDHLKYSHYIKEVIVIGEGRKYITALIQIDMENVGFWAQKNRIAFTTFKNLSRQPAVRELIQQEVEKSNKKFSRVEHVKKFALLDKELDQDDGELTATQKVRRKQINEIYKDVIDSLYA
jgi:long-chain acyl-CoA synthetase